MSVFEKFFGSRPERNEPPPVQQGLQGFVVDEKKPSPVAIIYRSELDFISRCILDYPDIETGGDLFGFWSNEGIPIVAYVTGPGPNANHQVASFGQDKDYALAIGNQIISKYGIQHIGEWHSHHQLGLDHPSGTDANNIVSAIQKTKLRRLLLCIGICDGYKTNINAFTFHQNDVYNYLHAAWNVKDLSSPFRKSIDEELSRLIIYPNTKQACHDKLYVVERLNQVVIPSYQEGYWLQLEKNNLILKQIIDYIEGLEIDSKHQVSIDKRKNVHVRVYRPHTGIMEDIIFGQEFPYQAPIIEQNNRNLKSSENTFIEDASMRTMETGQWIFNGDIYESFINYYNKFYYGSKKI